MNRAAAFFFGFAAGFVAGRAGHVMFGPYPGYHHWIYGIIAIVIGACAGSFFAIGFGFGLVVSDFNDFEDANVSTPSAADLTAPRHFIGVD